MGPEIEQGAHPINVASPVAPRLEDQGRPAALGLVHVDPDAVPGQHLQDPGVGDAGPGNLDPCRVGAGLEQGLEDVGALPPHGKADQPAAVGPRIGSPRQQHGHDAEVTAAHGVVQHRGPQTRILLCLLRPRQTGVPVEILRHRAGVPEKGGGADVGGRPPGQQTLGDRVVALVACGAAGGDLDQERREVTAAGVDVGPSVEQVVDHGQPPPVRGFPQHGAPVGAGTADPVRLPRQHHPDRLQIAAPGRRHGDLHEIAGLARQEAHGLTRNPPGPALTADRENGLFRLLAASVVPRGRWRSR